jgi:hypothetical protein
MHTSEKHLILDFLKTTDPLSKESKKIIIGRVEKIDFPHLHLYHLDAKIDTGAYTSSLHCHDIELEIRNGRHWVHFYVLDPGHPEYGDIRYESPVHKIKNVRSSNGQVEERVIIKQSALFFGKKRMIELSLTDRSEMKFPVLIGRKFMMRRYVVDVSKKFLYNKHK